MFKTQIPLGNQKVKNENYNITMEFNTSGRRNIKASSVSTLFLSLLFLAIWIEYVPLVHYCLFFSKP